MGFEPMIRVLQTLALPLGHVALLLLQGDFTRERWIGQVKKEGGREVKRIPPLGGILSGRWDSNFTPSWVPTTFLNQEFPLSGEF